MKFIRKISNYLLLLAVAVVISLLFPDQGRFGYQYNLGQTWKYEDLYAPFDFAIKKPASEIRALENQIKASFRPYYLHDLSLKENAILKFDEVFETVLENINLATESQRYIDITERPDRYRQIGEQYLKELLNVPVVEELPVQNEIVVVRNNMQYITPKSDLALLSDQRLRLQRELPGTLPDISVIIPAVSELIQPNTFYQDSLSERLLQMELNNISRHRGMVNRGDLIVMNGSIVTEDIFARLQSYEIRFQEDIDEFRNRYVVFGGFFLVSMLIVFLLGAYLKRFESAIFKKSKDMLFISIWLVVFPYLTYVMEHYELLSVYMIPYCILPIVLKNFFDKTITFLVFLSVILLSSFITTEGYMFTSMHIIAGLVALYTSLETRYWSSFFLSITFIFLSYIASFLGLAMFESGLLANIDYEIAGWLAFGSFLTLLAYPLIPLSERIFGYLSNITLAELADMDKPLLKKMSIRAPGTFQHTLQVANLSEAAAKKIGANSLLVKVGALYHDIGKMKNPFHFIENQAEESPHKNLDPETSASIIIEHVTEGIRLAKKEGLPPVIIDFIASHHGTTRVEYFYHKYKKNNNSPDNDNAFRYPGPRPKTREEVILMLADSIEASCKSLKSPTSEDIDEMVDKITRMKISEEQLDRSSMSFNDLATIKRVFKNMLKSIHHVRIEYPEERKSAQQNPQNQDEL